jgi:hypothetical protein
MSQLYQISEKIIENKKIINTIFKTEVLQETLNRLSIYFITNKSDIEFFYTRLHNNNIPDISIHKLTKEDYINFYLYVKKIKSSVNKIIQLYKFKFKKQKITTDLYLNPLSNYKDEKKIKLLIDNIIYEFVLSDLKKLWVKKLKQVEGLFIYPDNLKNPYTNIHIKKHNLYNIYFKLFFNNNCIPIVLKLLFECDMNCSVLSVLHFPLLKSYAIDNYIIHSSINTLFDEINEMFLEYIDNNKVIILSAYTPYKIKKKLVTNLRKYLSLYFFAKYSSNTIVKQSYDKRLKVYLNDYIDIFPNLELLLHEQIYITKQITPVSDDTIDITNRILERLSNELGIPTTTTTTTTTTTLATSEPPPRLIQTRPTLPPPPSTPPPSIQTTRNNNTNTQSTRSTIRNVFSLRQGFRPRTEIPRTPPNFNLSFINRTNRINSNNQ